MFRGSCLVTSTVGFLPRVENSAKDLHGLSQILRVFGTLELDVSTLFTGALRGASDLLGI